MLRNVRVAVVGVGAWGERQLRACEATSGMVVAAIADQRISRLQALRPDLPAFAGAEQLFAARVADAVIIATPTASHAGLAAAALEAGLHVLVEKPLATSRAAAERPRSSTRASPVANAQDSGVLRR